MYDYGVAARQFNDVLDINRQCIDVLRSNRSLQDAQTYYNLNSLWNVDV